MRLLRCRVEESKGCQWRKAIPENEDDVCKNDEDLVISIGGFTDGGAANARQPELRGPFCSLRRVQRTDARMVKGSKGWIESGVKLDVTVEGFMH